MLHHTFPSFLFEGVPPLLKLGLELTLLYGHERVRGISEWQLDRTCLAASVGDAVAQGADTSMDELLHFHWHDDLVFVDLAARAPEAEFKAALLLDWVLRVGEIEATHHPTVLQRRRPG